MTNPPTEPPESWKDLLEERARALAGDRPAAGANMPGSANAVGNPSPALVDARRFLDFAFGRKEPIVPAGSRFESAKRAVLRAFRPVTRPQVEYNAAVVEVLERVLAELDARRWEGAELRGALESGRTVVAEQRAAFDRFRDEAAARLDEEERRSAAAKSRLALLEGAFREATARIEGTSREAAARMAALESELASLGRTLAAEQQARDEVARHAARIEQALAGEQAARDGVGQEVSRLSAALDRLVAQVDGMNRPGQRPADLAREIERIRALAAFDRERMEELARGATPPASSSSAAPGEFPSAPANAGVTPRVGPSAIAPLSEASYFDFEDRFRGPEEEIRTRQEVYVPFFRETPAAAAAAGPVLDAGCGRGEFLELLGAAGIAATGVDSNGAMVARCRAKGLDVRQGDLFDELRGRGDASLAGLFAAQVVEHLSIAELAELLRLARRKVATGGALVLETINPESVWAMRWFWNDPTHVRPVPATTLEALARGAGFASSGIRWLSPVDDATRLAPGGDENLAKLDRAIFGFQDYALLARVPS